MDMNILLGPHNFSLQSTIEHFEYSKYFGRYTTPVNCCETKHLFSTMTELESMKWYMVLDCIYGGSQNDHKTEYRLNTTVTS